MPQKLLYTWVILILQNTRALAHVAWHPRFVYS